MKKITRTRLLPIKVFIGSVVLVSSLAASGLLFEKITDPLEVTVKDCVELKNSPYMSVGTKSKCESFISVTQPLLDKREDKLLKNGYILATTVEAHAENGAIAEYMRSVKNG